MELCLAPSCLAELTPGQVLSLQFAGAIILVIVFMPEGLWGYIRLLGRRFARPVALPAAERAMRVGGRGTLLGAVIGAVGVSWLQSILTTTYPDLWLLVLGGLFVGVVLFFPDGLVGGARRLTRRLETMSRGALRGRPDTTAMHDAAAERLPR